MSRHVFISLLVYNTFDFRLKLNGQINVIQRFITCIFYYYYLVHTLGNNSCYFYFNLWCHKIFNRLAPKQDILIIFCFLSFCETLYVIDFKGMVYIEISQCKSPKKILDAERRLSVYGFEIDK